MRRRSWQEIALYLLATALLVLAAFHLSNTISTVARFTLNDAFQDQLRLNFRYLTVPFPLSIFELENGHRPVLPGLIRWLELNYFAGAVTLQFATAWISAAVAVGLLFVRCWSALDWPHRLMLLCVVATTIFWNANARMFIHAYEATHVFYIFVWLVVALFAVSGEGEVTIPRVALACSAAALATFSFGPGIVVYGAVAVALVLRRASWKALAAVVVVALVVVAVYSFGLPGADGVRASSGAISLVQTSYFVVARMAAYWVELCGFSFASDSWPRGVVVTVSTLGITLTALHVLRAWRTRENFSPAMLMGLGIMVFGVVTNALIAVNRTSYFQANPPELFADRYLFWSTLVWLGLAIYWLSLPQRSRFFSLFIALIIVAESALAFGQANWWRSWASSTYRVVELTSVALKLNIPHDHRLQEMFGPDFTNTYAEIDVLRKARVSTFAREPGPWLGRTLVLPVPKTETPIAVSTDTRDLPKDSLWEILGGATVPRIDAHRLSGWQFWVTDESGKVIGMCAKTGLRSQAGDYSRYFKPVYNQFDCYVERGHDDKLTLIATNGETAKSVMKLAPVVRDKAFIPGK